jgi:hypothetical protein
VDYGISGTLTFFITILQVAMRLVARYRRYTWEYLASVFVTSECRRLDNYIFDNLQRGKRMKKLLITLLLISPFSFADWGDVYYCQMTTLSDTTPEGKRTDYKLEKFTFKLDKTKNAMVFGKGGVFGDDEMELEEWGYLSKEKWRAISYIAKLRFEEGKFLYSSVSQIEINSITADCDKF